MERHLNIVPIQLDNQNDLDPMLYERQLAFEIKDTHLKRTVSEYQGIGKNILYAWLKEL